ncbi:MAG: recombinase family protein, partial [Clostridia bacterium]|nr:recombinase family protein [Clostridia bacterium]
MAKFEKVGVYMRLSRDDEKAGESMSIENQRIILQKFVEERGGTVIDEYVDDGFSGTNFDRPAVKRMLQDAQSGKIDTIVVKDLSRFGRNYIQVGQYVDYIFPAYGIRFIAINDNVDTADRDSTAMDMMPVMNVFNEWHAANTSKKIRAVLEASQRSGKYTNWNYPYGYRAGNDVNRTAVIDEEAASVVRRIFQLRAQGNSARAICRILTDGGIPNPSTYFTRADGEKSKRRCSPYWVQK